METETSKSKDCEVCEKLIREKHKYDFLWKIFCVLFLATSIIFAILYFGSGSLSNTKNIQVQNSDIGNEVYGDMQGNGNIFIGSDNNVVDGQTKDINETLVICVSCVACVCLVIIGGIFIAHYNKKDG